MKLLTLFVAPITLTTFAQDTLQPSKIVRYPIFKHITVQKDYIGKSNYKTYGKDGALKEKGELSTERFKLSAIIPVYAEKSITMMAGLNYTRENITYFDEKETDLYQKAKLKTNDFDASFSVIHKGSLFNKPIVSRATVVLGSSNFVGIKKISGSISSAIVLKAGPTTVTTLGAVIILDQSSLVPFFPLFTYWHKFSDSSWELDVILPQKVAMRRSGVWNGWITAGIELNSNSFFIRQASQEHFRKGNYEWISNEIQTSIAYEHLLGRKIVLGLKGGYINSLSTRLVKVNDPIDKYKSRTRLASPFFNLNFGFLLN